MRLKKTVQWSGMKRADSAAKFWLKIDGLAILAGALYVSWPLGSILNPNISRRGLASDLEGLRQPYNWVFISADVLSSVLIAAVCWLIWRHLRHSPRGRMLKFVLVNVVLFGVGTVIDALLPLRCEPDLQRCPSFTRDPILFLHGLFSIQAAICLFVSLAVLWWYRRRNLMLGSLMVGYLLFSLFSVISLLEPGLGNLSQHYYLTLCGIWLALLPHAVRRSIAKG